MPANKVVMTMSPVTAMPYAAAKLPEDLKLKTSAITPSIKPQLTRGM